MKAMIFAAGLGTRLKPLTNNLPKALVPVCGEPLLSHVISALEKAGVRDYVINTHHFSSMIHDYVNSREDLRGRVEWSDELGQLLETGGGILAARSFLEKEDRFLVHNVDILSNLDIPAFLLSCPCDAMATLLVSERETQRYLLFDAKMRLVGWTNISTGEVRSPYADLDVAGCRRYAFAGIHCMSSSVFQAMESLGFGEKFSIIDFYLSACKDYPVYGHVADNLEMVDVGKLETLEKAEEFIKRNTI